MVQDIKLTRDKHIDDYFTIVLLSIIPESYSDVKSAMKYVWDDITPNNTVNALKSKDIDLKHGISSRTSNEKVM